jgi:molybdopterin-containing oxidoreductase family membrane subunit
MWFKGIRINLVITFILSIIVNIGMWFERFVIIVSSIHRDYITSSWTQFHPTFVDMGVFVGTIGIFFVLYLLYARTFPVLALNEVKTILRATGEFGVKMPPAMNTAVVEETEADESIGDSNDDNKEQE